MYREDFNDNSLEPIKEYLNNLGWRIYAATIGSAAVMFVICGILNNSSMK
jgi:dolichyl-phosphate-mannose--protein O-mannosyl transferase